MLKERQYEGGLIMTGVDRQKLQETMIPMDFVKSTAGWKQTTLHT